MNIALGVYGLSLQIKGLVAFHDLTVGQAAIAAVVATLSSGIVVSIGGILLFAVLGAFLMDLGETTTEPGPGTGPGQDPESFTLALTQVLEYAPQVLARFPPHPFSPVPSRFSERQSARWRWQR